MLFFMKLSLDLVTSACVVFKWEVGMLRSFLDDEYHHYNLFLPELALRRVSTARIMALSLFLMSLSEIAILA